MKAAHSTARRTLNLLACAWLGMAAGGAQAQQQGALFAFSSEDRVSLRWNAALEAGYRGYHVERRAAGGDWVRLTADPVVPITDVQEIRDRLGFNADAYLTFFPAGATSITPADFERVTRDEIARSFIQLFSVKEPAIGEVLGEVFADTQLEAGQTFDYRVIRIDPAGAESPWAQTAAPVTHGAVDRVPVPEDVRGQEGDSIAMLGWKHDPALSRTGALVAYHVYRSNRAYGPYQRITAEAIVPAAIDGQLPEFFLTDGFLTNGTSYWYEVRGMNVLGIQGEPGDRVEVIPRDLTPPPPPESLSGSLLDGYGLLEWPAVEAADLAGYRIYRADLPEGPFDLVAPDAEGSPLAMTSYLDQDIAEGEVVWYEVTAVDTSGNESRPSPVVEVNRPDITPPAAPVELSAESGDDGIHLRWAANAEADLAGYLVKRTTRVSGAGDEATVSGDFFALNVTPSEATAYTDPVPRESESHYAYHVVAVDEAGNRSQPSDWVVARMPDIVPPARVAVAGILLETEDVVIRWNRSLEPDLAGYHVQRSPAASERYTRLNERLLAPDVTEYRHQPKETGEVWTYQVTAVDRDGNESAPSFPLSIRYLDVVGPAPPTDLNIRVIESGLELNWKPSPARDVAYVYLYRQVAEDGQPVPVLEMDPGQVSFVDTVVEEDQTYAYFLRAFDSSVNAGPPGDTVTATFTRDQAN